MASRIILFSSLAVSFILLSAGLLVQAGAPGSPSSAPRPGDEAGSATFQRLDPAVPVDRDLEPGEIHRYRLYLDPELYAEVEVRQKDVEVSVALLGLEEGVGLSFPNGPRGVQTVALLGREAPLDLEVRFESRLPRPGSYELRVTERPAEAADEVRLRAQKAYAHGLRLHLYTEPPRLEQALELYRRARETWRLAGEVRREAYSLIRVGEVLWRLEQRRPAVDAFEEALEPLRRAGDSVGGARARYAVGRHRYDLGDLREALGHYHEGLTAARHAGDRELEAGILNSLGSVLQDLGETGQAERRYKQALAFSREFGDDEMRGAVLNNLGVIANDLGRSELALDRFREALSIYRRMGNRSQETITLHNLGTALDRTGEKQQALDHYRQALEGFEELGQQRALAFTHINLGRLYSTLGDTDSAVDHYVAGLEISREVEDKRAESWALSNLGAIYRKRGELEKAEESLSRALTLRRQVGDRRGEAFTLNGLGEVDLEWHREQAARERFEQALEVWREIGDPRGSAMSLRGLGRVHEAAGEWGAALDVHEEALALARSTQDPEGEAGALFGIARVLRRQGVPEAALEQIRAAIGVLESVRHRVAAEELRASFLASKRPYYDLLVSLLMELDEREPAAGWSAAAFEAAEGARARGLLETLLASGEIRAGVAPDLLAKEQSLRRALNARDYRRSRLGSQSAAEEKEALDTEIADLLERLRAVRAEIRSTNPAYASLTQPLPVSPERVRRHLGPDSLLLAYWLGEEQSYLWSLTAQSFRVHRLPPRAEIEATARRWADLLRSGNRLVARMAEAEVSASLSRLLLAPVRDQLPGRRLLVVGEGALQYVPFAALPVPWAAEQPAPLVAQHEIVTLPSASMLALEERRQRPAASSGLAVVADPVFSRDDPRVRSAAAAMGGRPPEAKPSAFTRAARDLGLGDFPRLPFTRREAEAIGRLAAGREIFQALDFEASRALAEDGRLAPFRILHFATHGLLDSTHPELSGLVLSLVDERGEPRDGFLRLHDVYNLDLGAELVVLSGCETALGKEVWGEGLVGLTRGFQYAGAAGVVASLWRVDDEATAKLMEHFYRGLLEHGLPPESALRQAQIRLWKQPATRSPYYWAGFVYQGG